MATQLRELDVEEAFHLLVENVKDHGIFMMDPAGSVISWNVGAQRIFGYTEAEIIGQPFSHLFPPDESAEAGAELGRAQRDDRATDDRWHVRKDGTRLWCSGVTTALREKTAGTLKGFVKVLRDLTHDKELENALKASEAKYRRLFETAKDGILILDASTGKITDANPFMAKLLGYDRAEFMGKELWQIGLFHDIGASRAAYRELRAKGYVRFEHLPLATKAGRPVEVEFISNIYEVNGQEVAQCNIRDITDRSRLERQAAEQAVALADLARRKDEFLAMLSHELRNPLAAIHYGVKLLGRQQGHENQHQRLARTVIEHQVGQMAHCLDDLLEVGRITTGRIRLQKERMDIRGIAERALETVRPLLDERKHELSVSLPPEPIWLHADPTRLEQVVVNVLHNAAKYTDVGGRIALTIQQEDDKAVLRVRDNGTGIAAELLPRVFDLFTQADRSLDRAQGGLGIGLCVVQRLVEMHGGTVGVHSAGLRQGSEFSVRLPVAPAPAPS